MPGTPCQTRSRSAGMTPPCCFAPSSRSPQMTGLTHTSKLSIMRQDADVAPPHPGDRCDGQADEGGAADDRTKQHQGVKVQRGRHATSLENQPLKINQTAFYN